MYTHITLFADHPMMEVRVYRNLTRKCWSVQHKTKRGWRVLSHTDSIALQDATFQVVLSGRDRVRREHKKYVHAYVYGRIATINSNFLGIFDGEALKVLYNPYKDDHFIYSDGNNVNGLHYAFLNKKGVFVSNYFSYTNNVS